MIKHYFLPDQDGKLISCGTIDGDLLPIGAIETTGEMISQIPLAHGLVRWHDDTKQFSFPQDDKRIWKALMSEGSHTGRGAFETLSQLQHLKATFPVDTPSSVDFTNGAFFKRPVAFPEYSFPEVSGLVVRAFDLEKDFDLVMEAAIQRGVHTEEEWGDLAGRLEVMGGQQFLWTWNGEPIQIELYDVDEMNLIVHATRTIHFSKARPYWFWRELMKPVYGWFDSHGIEKIVSIVGTVRRDWIEALKKNFNPKVFQISETAWKAVYPLDLSLFKGWPERKTLGNGWSMETSDGVLVREMGAEEIPQIKEFIKDSWGDNPRKSLPLHLVGEWFFLDRATLLGGFVNGKLSWVRAMRYRKDSIAGLAEFNSVDCQEPKVRQSIYSKMEEWARQVGYSKITYFIEQKLRDRALSYYDPPDVKVIALHDNYKIPMYEMEFIL